MKPSAEAFLEEYLFGLPAKSSRSRALPAVEKPAIRGRRAPAYLARRFSQIMQGVMAEAVEPHGLMPQQWGIIVAIVREPGTDQRRVAERQSIDANTASRLIDELEASGLVRRLESPDDRRAKCLELTSAGVLMWQKLHGPLIAAQDRVLVALNQTEKKSLLDMLTRVVEANQAYARPGNGRRRPVRAAARTQEKQSA
jgi:MarR family transcriptional regulator, temperature-dependent positive regulator of motility